MADVPPVFRVARMKAARGDLFNGLQVAWRVSGMIDPREVVAFVVGTS